MVYLKFRIVRSVWLVLFACTALSIDIFSLIIWPHYARNTDAVVVMVVPGICFLTSLTALLARYLFSNPTYKSVAVEILWTGCMSPLAMILVIYSYSLVPGMGGPGAIWPFIGLRVFSWALASLITLYTVVLMLVTFATAATIDREVWIRPIAGSPSPFPLAVVVHILWARTRSRQPSDMEKRTFCPPGCACANKLPPSISSPLLEPRAENVTMGDAEAQRDSTVPGIRVPTALERHSTIFIGFVMVDIMDMDTDVFE
ncbi:hypothetical protein K488DRAFT_88210 [Vararia minispora EC-137]|uniref:Uncharacterized protein n=1 Tax=Vararia minispora EC-137 TaxID=1314806 RepID=A0ACB8QE09_9AGAM|nr:hypothetical protein K488DRAFT_88210 [Vararia minispora EC-137]